MQQRDYIDRTIQQIAIAAAETLQRRAAAWGAGQT